MLDGRTQGLPVMKFYFLYVVHKFEPLRLYAQASYRSKKRPSQCIHTLQKTQY
jgi:hypothetical protein